MCSAGPRRLTGAGTRTRSTDTAHANVDCQHTSTVRLSSRPQHARGNTPRDNRQPNRWAPTSAGMGALVGRDFLHTHRENSKKSPLRGAPFPAHPRGFGGQGAKKTLHISSTFWSRCAAHGRFQMRCNVHPLTEPVCTCGLAVAATRLPRQLLSLPRCHCHHHCHHHHCCCHRC